MSSPSPSSSSSSFYKPHNVYAQKLNNSAALCIEVGQYDRAILSLQRALRLSELQMSDKVKDTAVGTACSCKECTLDGCFAFSENNILSTISKSSIIASASVANSDSSGSNSNRSNKRRRIEVAATSNDTDASFRKEPMAIDGEILENANHINDNGNESSSHFIFSCPIRVNRQGHEMGTILFLVILFNLAMAHHLKATTHSMNRAKSINKALLLYELVFEYWSRHQENKDGSVSPAYDSIRFNMILYNNLSQIYRSVNNPIKQRQCLQHLLSTVLFVTDYKTRNNHNSNSSSNGDVDVTNNLDGFLTNTAALTIHERCAGAA